MASLKMALCFFNLVFALRRALYALLWAVRARFKERKWLTITYEELLLRPIQMINLISKYLCLPEKEKMLNTILKPSNTSSS